MPRLALDITIPIQVVRHGSRAAFLHRQARLTSVECLNLAFFVDRQDDGVCRGIDIEADNVAELLSEFRVCKRRSKNPSMKQPSWSVAPE